jgi:membrane dipeptidase
MTNNKTRLPAEKNHCLAKLLLALFTSVAITACAMVEWPHSIEERARTVHQNSLVLDAHADIVIASTSRRYMSTDGTSKVSPDKLVAGGVGAVVMSIAVGPGPRTEVGDANARKIADEKLSSIRSLLSANPNTLMQANTVSNINTAERTGKIAIILGFQNARSLQGSIRSLDYFYDQGVRIFGLNHLAHNDFSDSSRPNYNIDTSSYEITEEHAGLSALGVKAIIRINDLGAVVDVSQLSRTATLQTISLSRSPVIASHSNVQAITNVTRNLSDHEIDQIGNSGGVIHIAAFGAYLVDLSKQETLNAIKAVRLKHSLPKAYSYPYELYWELPDADSKRTFLVEMRDVIGAGNVQDMANHIDYIVDRIGIDHVGIGNDFNHGSGIQGYADASESLNLTIELIKRGYSQTDIKKIWGKNFLRVFQSVESLARE